MTILHPNQQKKILPPKFAAKKQKKRNLVGYWQSY